MKTIKVLDLCGAVCVDPDDGAKVCEAASKTLAAGEGVCFDFTGVTTLTGSFLNAAIGCLYGSFDKERIERDLNWTGLDETDQSLVRLVQVNAMRYFSASRGQRDVLATSQGQTPDR